MDELGHMIRHVAQQGGDQTPFRYGHIATYDPALHRVRCIIPSMTDQDGNPTLSPWMPLGTLSAGGGYGIQIFYQGGATVQNPTAGEQVLIATFDRQRGVSAVPTVFFHTNSLPPTTNLPSKMDGYNADAGASAPGDIIISAPSASQDGANSFIRMRKDGTIQIWSAGQIQADVIGGLTATVNTGDVDVTVAEGNMNATVSQGSVDLTATKGNVTVNAPAGVVDIFAKTITLAAGAGAALMQLCTTAFATLYNSHTHTAPNGTTSVPLQPASQTQLTQVVLAE